MSATRPMSSTDQRWNWGKSSSGSPSRRAMTRTGNSKVSWRTRSASPSAAKRSISSSMIGPMNSGSQRARDFSRKAWATRLRCAAVLGVVHAQDHVAHDHADGGVVAGRGEGLGVAQDARAVVVAEGDPPGLDLDALGQDVERHGRPSTPGCRGACAKRRVGVPGRARHDVVEGGERVVLLASDVVPWRGSSPGRHCDVGVQVTGRAPRRTSRCRPRPAAGRGTPATA